VTVKFAATGVRVVVDATTIDALLKDRGGFVNAEIHALADEVRFRVQLRCPEGHRTRHATARSPQDYPGQLRESIYVIPKPRGLGFNIGSHMPYTRREQWHNKSHPQFLTGGLAEVVGAHGVKAAGFGGEE
jgi:hypothetical protein